MAVRNFITSSVFHVSRRWSVLHFRQQPAWSEGLQLAAEQPRAAPRVWPEGHHHSRLWGRLHAGHQIRWAVLTSTSGQMRRSFQILRKRHVQKLINSSFRHHFCNKWCAEKTLTQTVWEHLDLQLMSNQTMKMGEAEGLCGRCTDLKSIELDFTFVYKST